MTGHHRDGTEFTHSACVTENHAVHQSPAYLWQGDTEEGDPSTRAKCNGCLLLIVTQLLHERNELTCHIGECHEHGGEDNPRQRKDNADVVILQPHPEPAMQPEQQYVHHT